MDNTTTTEPYDYQDQLNKWHFSITRAIRPRVFYSYLRSQGVLTIDDEEEIEGTFVTNAMKAGNLIDIIQQKGVKGFKAFMEVIQYSYPSLYLNLTGVPPNAPPESYHVHNKRPCASTSDTLLECMNSLNECLKEKKNELQRLEETIETLESEYKEEICQLNTKIENLERQKDKLDHEIMSLKEKEQEREANHRSMKAKGFGGNNCLREKTENVAELEKELRALIESESNVQKDQTIQELKRELDLQKDRNTKLEEKLEQLSEKYNQAVVMMEMWEKEFIQHKPGFDEGSFRSCSRRAMKNNNLGIMREISKEERTNRSDLVLKRRASVPSVVSPLIIYSSNDIVKDIYKQLAVYFKLCPVDVIKSEDEKNNRLSKYEILHYDFDKTKEYYSCIMYDTLIKLKETTLLSIPITSVGRLRRVSIIPILVLIKFENEQGYTEIMKEEEYLEKELEGNGHIIKCENLLELPDLQVNEPNAFYIFLLCEKLKSDIPKLVEFILPHLQSLVKKYEKSSSSSITKEQSPLFGETVATTI